MCRCWEFEPGPVRGTPPAGARSALLYLPRRRGVEPCTAPAPPPPPPPGSTVGHQVAGGRGASSAGRREETGNRVEGTSARKRGAGGGAGRTETWDPGGRGLQPGAGDPGSPSARHPGTGAGGGRAAERQGVGAERGAGRPGSGGRGGPARDPNGCRRRAGARPGEAPPGVGLNGAPPRTPPIGARAAAPWRPFVAADRSRLPNRVAACLAAQVSGRAVGSSEPPRPPGQPGRAGGPRASARARRPFASRTPRRAG